MPRISVFTAEESEARWSDNVLRLAHELRELCALRDRQHAHAMALSDHLPEDSSARKIAHIRLTSTIQRLVVVQHALLDAASLNRAFY